MKIQVCQYDECGKEYIPAKYGFSKYCSAICRSRASKKRQGKDAKPFKCLQCGELFKRRSAKNTRCPKCRNNTELGKKVIVTDIVPVTDRDVELSMIKKWIDNPKNKIKVG